MKFKISSKIAVRVLPPNPSFMKEILQKFFRENNYSKAQKLESENKDHPRMSQ